MAQRILVTGAAGFVGTYLTDALRQRWPESMIEPLGEVSDVAGANFIDLRDFTAVDEMVAVFRPDVVVHLAAQSSVARAQDAAALTWQVNLSGTLALALAIARHVPEAIVLFASTSEVYGASFLHSPVDETSAPVPLNPYAKSKAAAERVLADVLPPSCHLIIARAFNHTGPGQRQNFVLPSFAAQIAAIEVGQQNAPMMVGNLDIRRDFLDVRDVVAAYIALIEMAPQLPLRFIVNVASGVPRLLRDMLDELRYLAKTPIEVAVDPQRLRSADLPIAFARPAFLQAVTGWHPRHALSDTLGSLLTHARRLAQLPQP